MTTYDWTISQCDHDVATGGITDAPVDQAAWAVYRQALRDVPQ